jgi:hypothetical protein
MRQCYRTLGLFGNKIRGSRRGFLKCRKMKVKKSICKKAKPAELYSDAKGTPRVASVHL